MKLEEKSRDNENQLANWIFITSNESLDHHIKNPHCGSDKKICDLKFEGKIRDSRNQLT